MFSVPEPPYTKNYFYYNNYTTTNNTAITTTNNNSNNRMNKINKRIIIDMFLC